MKLRSIEWQGYSMPFREPVRTTAGVFPIRQGLLLRLTCDTGLDGWGEASPVGAGSEQELLLYAKHLQMASEHLAELCIEGLSSLSRSSLSSPAGGLPAGLRFGIETALLDIIGKSSGKPAASLLGGSPRTIGVNALVTGIDPDEAARQARDAVSEGFKALKLKVGFLSLEHDTERVAAVRRAAGHSVSIRLDANQGWTATEAIKAIRLMEQHGLEYVEQPVDAADIPGMHRVRAAVSTPIAADESISSMESAFRVIRSGAADILIIKAARLGLLESLRVMHMATTYHKRALVTSSFEVGIGLAASLHLAAALPDCGPSGLGTAPLMEDLLVTESLCPIRGVVACPHTPGIGLGPHREALSRYSSQIMGHLSL